MLDTSKQVIDSLALKRRLLALGHQHGLLAVGHFNTGIVNGALQHQLLAVGQQHGLLAVGDQHGLLTIEHFNADYWHLQLQHRLWELDTNTGWCRTLKKWLLAVGVPISKPLTDMDM